MDDSGPTGRSKLGWANWMAQKSESEWFKKSNCMRKWTVHEYESELSKESHFQSKYNHVYTLSLKRPLLKTVHFRILGPSTFSPFGPSTLTQDRPHSPLWTIHFNGKSVLPHRTVHFRLDPYDFELDCPPNLYF